jgi:hypothetical protein
LKLLATSSFTAAMNSKNSSLPRPVDEEVIKEVGSVSQLVSNFFL